MLRNKRILLLIIVVALLFLIPSICNAAEITATQTTTTSTGKTVKWSYELEGDNIVNLKCTNVSEVTGTVDIPSTIDGYTVITIGNSSNEYTHYTGAFEECVGLTGVTIPNTVTIIGVEAFRGCVGLKSVVIPNNVTKISLNAFDGCIGLKNITLGNNLATIGGYAFRNCTGVKEITIPESVTSIGDVAFGGCTGLKSIVIPDNVTSLGKSAFQDCSGLTSVTLSNNLTKINRQTFSACTGLTSIVIPNSVTTIAGYDGIIYGAFEDCTKLEKVLIPDTVATIEKSAFYNCPKLTIYGNDNQASKTYAEDNNINFDYIANYDKAAVGDDITPPSIKSLEIENSSMFKYDEGTNYYLAAAGTNISIKVTFEEVIYGETAPTLTIKCGNGSNINITNGVIQGKYIIYTYTIKDQDKGIIKAVSMTGGDIKDEAGNAVKNYVCPELVTTDIIWSRYVYANGTGSVANNQGNNQSSTVTLSSIAITKAPTKKTYTEGEKFDKTGMIITATYSNGSTKQITNYSVSPSVALKTTDKKVVITYTENGVTKTVEQKITVVAKGTNNNASNADKDNDSSSTDDTIKDTTIKNDSKLPQTGVTVLSLAVISLIAVAVISKIKSNKYKDI